MLPDLCVDKTCRELDCRGCVQHTVLPKRCVQARSGHTPPPMGHDATNVRSQPVLKLPPGASCQPPLSAPR